jgi:acyl carrier protein
VSDLDVMVRNMDADDIVKLRISLSDHFDIPATKFTDDVVLSDLGFDKLDLLEALLVIEEATGAYIKDESLTEHESQGHICFGRLCEIAEASPSREDES